MMLSRIAPLLLSLPLFCACSGDFGTDEPGTDEVSAAEQLSLDDIELEPGEQVFEVDEFGQLQQAITESTCTTSLNPNFTLQTFERGEQRTSPTQNAPYGAAACTEAYRVQLRVGQVANGRSTAFYMGSTPTTASTCTATSVRGRLVRDNQVILDQTNFGAFPASLGQCVVPSVSTGVRPYGDGARWIFLVQAKRSGNLQPVRVNLTAQQQ